MDNYKYYVKTFHQLPVSKFLLDSQDDFHFILMRMLAKKPKDYVVDDIENSVSCHRINIKMLPEYRDIFKELTFWHWDTVRVVKPEEKDHD